MITSWSPSRIEKYEKCPRRAKYEIVDKLCPLCFKGSLVGFDDPTCNLCNGKPGVPEPIARGTALHKLAEVYVRGELPSVPKELQKVATILKALKAAYKKNVVKVEHDFVFAKGWVPVTKFTKGAWLRTKADIIHVLGKVARLVDWKSGGIDKATGEVKAQDKYDDQLEIYGIAALCAMPTVDVVEPQLVFIDGPEGRNVINGEPAKRATLGKLQKKWEKRIKPMFADTVFAPLPSNECRWCPFSRGKGGPCQY